MNKMSNQPEQMTIVITYASSAGASNFIKQTLVDLTAQISPNTMIIGDIDALFSSED
jgi:hypothetical protein